MADIPVYQYQKPSVIPTMEGLYQAAQAGYETGMKVPTVAGAIATGIKDAVTTYQDVAYKEAQTQNVQADAAYRQAQATYLLEGTKNQKDLAEIKYKEAQANKLNALASGQDNFNQVADFLSSSDPSQLKGVIDPQNPIGQLMDQIGATDPKKGKGLLALLQTRAGNDPDIADYIASKSKAYTDWGFRTQSKSINDTIRSSAISSGTKAMQELLEDNTLQGWFPEAQDIHSMFNGPKVYRQGVKHFVNGKLDKTLADTPDQASPDYYTLVDSQGNLIADSIPKDIAHKYMSAQRAYNYQHEDAYDAAYGAGAFQQLRQKQVELNPTIQNTPSQQTTQSSQQTTRPSNTNENIVAQQQGRSVIDNNASPQQNLIDSRKQYWRQQFRKTPVPPAQPQEAPSKPVEPKLYTPSSFDTLSEATGMPVDVNIKTDYSVHPETYNTINTNPLLANKSALIKGLAAVESGGKVDAESFTGVRGLLQVTKATAKRFGFNRDIPEQNVAAGEAYMTYLLSPKMFNGNLMLAAAAYNAGEGTIKDAVAQVGSTNWEDLKPYLSEKVNPDKWNNELHNYPERVLKAASQFVDITSPQDKVFVSLLSLNNLLTGKTLVNV